MSSYEDFLIINPEYYFYEKQSKKTEKIEFMKNNYDLSTDYPHFDLEEQKQEQDDNDYNLITESCDI